MKRDTYCQRRRCSQHRCRLSKIPMGACSHPPLLPPSPPFLSHSLPSPSIPSPNLSLPFLSPYLPLPLSPPLKFLKMYSFDTLHKNPAKVKSRHREPDYWQFLAASDWSGCLDTVELKARKEWTC